MSPMPREEAAAATPTLSDARPALKGPPYALGELVNAIVSRLRAAAPDTAGSNTSSFPRDKFSDRIPRTSRPHHEGREAHQEGAGE